MATDPEIRCPAGVRIHQGNVRCCLCRIESTQAALRGDDRAPLSLVKASTSPQSLRQFCEGRYTDCPTWRAEKRRRTVKGLADGGGQ